MLETRPCYLSVVSSWPEMKPVAYCHSKFELFLQSPLVHIDISESVSKHDGENVLVLVDLTFGFLFLL